MASKTLWLPFLVGGRVTDNNFRIDAKPLFTSSHFAAAPNEYTILATRGFWDFTFNQAPNSSSPFAITMAMTVAIPSVMFTDIVDNPTLNAPSPLSFDHGGDWFVYEPFVRGSTAGV